MTESKQSSTWTDTTSLNDLLSLPFDHLEHITDHYEMALLSLYKKNWSFSKIFIVHFFIMAPVVPLSFLTPSEKFGKVEYLRHVLETLVSLLIFFGSVWLFLKLTGYSELFPLLATIFSGSLFVLYIIFACNTFRPWRVARKHLRSP